jgi:hypothetical protein
VILGGASPLRAAHRLGAECVGVSPGPVPAGKAAPVGRGHTDLVEVEVDVDIGDAAVATATDLAERIVIRTGAK